MKAINEISCTRRDKQPTVSYPPTSMAGRRESERETETETERQTDRQTDRDRETTNTKTLISSIDIHFRQHKLYGKTSAEFTSYSHVLTSHINIIISH